MYMYIFGKKKYDVQLWGVIKSYVHFSFLSWGLCLVIWNSRFSQKMVKEAKTVFEHHFLQMKNGLWLVTISDNVQNGQEDKTQVFILLFTITLETINHMHKLRMLC